MREVKIKPRSTNEPPRDVRWREPLHDDVKRLVNSLRTTLRRRYPVEAERRIVEVRVLRELELI